MAKLKTNMKEVLALSPYLFEYQRDKYEVKEHVNKLIAEGLEASEVLHQVQVWMANNRMPSSDTPGKKAEYAGQFSVRTNAAGTISMKDTLKLPPYRRGSKSERVSPAAKKLSASQDNLPASGLREWLSSMEEDDRKAFITWCALQGRIADRALWDAFKLSRSHSLPPSQTLPVFETRTYISDSHSVTKIRRAQGKFRKDVLKNWIECCAITGSRFAVEACHILSHASGGVPSVENGIALASDLHRLLDSGHLRIEQNRAIFSDEASQDPRYRDYHGCELRKPLVPVMFP